MGSEMDLCELYGCGSGSYWTREDLDELQGELDDSLNSEGIYITQLYVKKMRGSEFFDLDYRYECDGDYCYDGCLMEDIRIDHRKAPTVAKLIEVYAPVLIEAIRNEVKKNFAE